RFRRNATASTIADTPAPKRMPRGSMCLAGVGVSRDIWVDLRARGTRVSGNTDPGAVDGRVRDVGARPGDGGGGGGPVRRPRARPSPALADDRSTADPYSPRGRPHSRAEA